MQVADLQQQNFEMKNLQDQNGILEQNNEDLMTQISEKSAEIR